MSGGAVTFWFVNAGVPIGTFIFNLVVRLIRQLSLSAMADWLLLFIAFDVVIVANIQDFLPYLLKVRGGDPVAVYFPVFLVLCGVAITTWIFCVFSLEPAMEEVRQKIKPWYETKVLLQFFFVSLVVIAVTGAHLLMINLSSSGGEV